MPSASSEGKELHGNIETNLSAFQIICSVQIYFPDSVVPIVHVVLCVIRFAMKTVSELNNCWTSNAMRVIHVVDWYLYRGW